MESLVSIVVPVYNAERYLAECLDSLIGQTYKELEIICVDDGSRDSSREIVHEYGRKDARVRLEIQEHSNAGAARNRGLTSAKGEFVAFLDADDFFEPAMIEKMVEKAVSTGADCVICRGIYYDNGRGCYYDMGDARFRNAKISDWDDFSKDKIGENVFRLTACAWDKLYRMAFIKEKRLLFQEQPVNNDLLFTYKAYILAERMAICGDVAVRYRTNNADSLQGGWGKDWQCIFKAFIALKEWLYQQGVWEQVARGFVNHAATAITSYMGKLTEWKWYVAFFEYFKKEGIGKLELLPREEGYYYDPAIYEKIVHITDRGCQEYLFYQMLSLSKAYTDGNLRFVHTRERLGKAKKQLEDMRNKLRETHMTYKNKRWYFQEDRLPEGSRVVIYGFGDVGRDLADQLSRSRRLHLIAVTDWNHDRFSSEEIAIRPPKEIPSIAFDYIVIAIHDRRAVAEVRDMLDGEGIDRSRMIWFEMESC